MKKLLFLSTVLLSNSLVFASIPLSKQIGSITVTDITPVETTFLKQAVPTPTTPTTTPTPTPVPPVVIVTPAPTPQSPVGTPMTPQEKLDLAGKVLDQTKNMVALGEAIYTLVQKGKPHNVTDYAPVMVVPKDPNYVMPTGGDPTKLVFVDPFDMEGFSMPVQKKFEVKIRNKTGRTVVNFIYTVMYSYGGSYNGAGKYITGVNIIPASVKTSFGYDFNSSMKVTGIMNHGTKANPIAGVMLTIKYSIQAWGTATEKNDTVHITGNGGFKAYRN